jgi:hypothetical protein
MIPAAVFRLRCTTNPCRTRIRFSVEVDGTVIPSGGFFNNSSRIRFAPHRGCCRRSSATSTVTDSPA